MNVKNAVAVTITSDLICPWCWIGLKELQQGAKLANVQPKITWKPFMLRPNVPTEGQPKDGTPASRVGSRLAAAGGSVGIEFTGLTDRTPNTALFHATLYYLQDELQLSSETVTDFHVNIFEAYFTLGIFPDDAGILENIQDHTVSQHVKDLYADQPKLDRLMAEVVQEAQEASRSSISGVPTFAFENDAPAFSGAQPKEVFAQVLETYSAAKASSVA